MQDNSIRIKPNYLYSIISVALVLWLLGFLGIVLLQASQLLTALREQISIMVELHETVPAAEKTALDKHLRATPGIKKGTLAFIDKEEGARTMQADFGEDFLKLGLPNPLRDVYTFHVDAAYAHPDSLSAMRTAIKRLPAASDVFYQASLVDKIAGNLKKTGYAALGVGLFFIFVALFLIHNTVRMALYANRFVIKNMELVGATWSFISRPYLVRAAQQGAISGALAILALSAALQWLQGSLPSLVTEKLWPNLLAVALPLLLLGVLINVVSTHFVIKRYLKMRVDDLY